MAGLALLQSEHQLSPVSSGPPTKYASQYSCFGSVEWEANSAKAASKSLGSRTTRSSGEVYCIFI